MNKTMVTGRILKSTGGFYYIASPDGEIEARARGVFRKEKLKPCVGDFVTVETDGKTGYILAVQERKNALVRPPLANIDQLIIVASYSDPQPNLYVIDKLIAVAEHKGIEPVLVFTKKDLLHSPALDAVYRDAGFHTLCVSAAQGEGMDALRAALSGKVSAFAGNSGVGKSSLLNALDERLGLSTGEISKKLGRGRHTTRHVELFELEGGGLVADTPGFSSVDTERLVLIYKDELQHCFREFEPYIGKCRFTGCSHTVEKDCAVLEALAKGEIASSRHESYLAMYEQAKQLREWEQRGV